MIYKRGALPPERTLHTLRSAIAMSAILDALGNAAAGEEQQLHGGGRQHPLRYLWQ